MTLLLETATPATIDTLDLNDRRVTDTQLSRFEHYMAEIFTAFGMDIDTPATAATPRRFVRAIFDATTGYDGDPKLQTVFETECRSGPDCGLSQVIQGPIQFHALCEHHALPFTGQACVGYIAHVQIIGISSCDIAGTFADPGDFPWAGSSRRATSISGTVASSGRSPVPDGGIQGWRRGSGEADGSNR